MQHFVTWEVKEMWWNFYSFDIQFKMAHGSSRVQTFCNTIQPSSAHLWYCNWISKQDQRNFVEGEIILSLTSVIPKSTQRFQSWQLFNNQNTFILPFCSCPSLPQYLVKTWFLKNDSDLKCFIVSFTKFHNQKLNIGKVLF